MKCEGCFTISENVSVVDSVPVILNGLLTGTIILDPVRQICSDCLPDFRQGWIDKYTRGEVEVAQKLTKFWVTQ